ncbi:protein kinase [Amycolatopsis sp. A133]|uniref:serine/threonine-protein kinase n=1 Tax=Amycolatopsis sp. A133 TaxID=3064472 RepID=UPI0027F454D1|nr:protein kinase [Amycolatopsis sp. A133]MDQ7802845.1 protein kinase [Amycolatopsis sp. A133]
MTHGRYALGEFTITPRQALDDERPPALLGGRYEVGRLIGSGGTARVYRAYDVRLTREVAVKIYDRDAVALDQRRRLREMTIQGSISHPGVVALLDSGTEHGRTYLVMQLVEGENLAERLLGGPMTAAEVTELADGLAEALTHVHARRIVHRDLKPANVFLSADGPLIGDFGIAHALDATHITGTGLIPGTAAYLAPEQVCGEPAGPPADVYALGLILLECLTGQREYLGTMVEAAMARLSRPPRIPDDAPAALAYTLRRMTQREPADRPSAAKVLDMLHAPPPTLPWSRTARSPRWRRRTAAADGFGTAGSAGADQGERSSAPGAAGHGSPAADLGHRDASSADHAWPTADPGFAPDPASDGWPADPAHHNAGLAPDPASDGWPEAEPAHHDASPTPGHAWSAAGASAPSPVPRNRPTAGPAPRHEPVLTSAEAPTHLHNLPAAAPADSPKRRRLAAAAGLTAAAVAAVSAMLLIEQEPGTGSPARPPAADSPAVSSVPTSSTPLAESGTPGPRPASGDSGARPSTSGPAPLEPAAVTHQNPAPPNQQPKPVKPEKTEKAENPGKGKGKGLGHDS